MATATTHLSYWLVGNPGNFPAGNPAHIVQSASKPTGYSYVALLGSTVKEVADALPQAVVSLPNGLTAPSGNQPGLGDVTVKGAGGIAGGIDKTITTAGNALSLTALFGSGSLWAGIGMTLLGAFLVLFGIVKLSGADPKAVAKRVV